MPITQAGRNIEDFQKLHDPNFFVPEKIRAGLASLGNSWMYTADFVRLCGISATQLGAFKTEFAAFTMPTGGKNPKQVWAGTAEFAAALRKKLGVI